MSLPQPTPTKYTRSPVCMTITDPITGCENPRPCDSCLQMKGCMVGLIGQCQPLGVKPSYDWYYANAKSRNLTLPGLKDSTNTSAINEKQIWEFPSIETTYCPKEDPVCKQCIQARFWLPSGIENDNRYCVGANDCVCIYNCEFNMDAVKPVCPRSPEPTLYTDESDTSVATASPPWTMPTLTTTPVPSTSIVATSMPRYQVETKADTMDTVLIVAGCFFGVACFIWIGYWCWRHRQPSVPMAVLVKVDTPRDQGDTTYNPNDYHETR